MSVTLGWFKAAMWEIQPKFLTCQKLSKNQIIDQANNPASSPQTAHQRTTLQFFDWQRLGWVLKFVKGDQFRAKIRLPVWLNRGSIGRTFSTNFI